MSNGIEFSDDSDNEGSDEMEKYRQMRAQAHTPRAPEPHVEEPEDEPGVSHEALPVRMQQSSEEDRRIARYADSGLFGSEGDLTKKQRQLCVKVIGYYPPDLLDKRTQLDLVQTYGDGLEEAFKMKLLRSFVFGINATAERMCSGITKASVAKSLLTYCLRNMSYNAKGREILIGTSVEIQQHMNALVDKTDAFVQHIEIMSTGMGRIATFLDYGASVDDMLDELQKLDADLAEKLNDVKQEVALATEKMQEASQYVQSKLQKDSQFSILQRDLTAHRHDYDALVQKLRNAHREDASHKLTLQVDIERQEREAKLQRSQVDQLREDLNHTKARLIKVRASRAKKEEMRQHVIDGTEEEKKQLELEDTNALVKSELKIITQSFDTQINSLMEKSSKLERLVEKYREKALAATDGTELITETTSRGWWIWRKTETVQVRKETHTNEKERLSLLANEMEKQKQALDEKIEQLQIERRNSRSKFKKAITDETRAMNAQVVGNVDSTGEERLKKTEQDLTYLRTLEREVEEREAELKRKLVQEETKLNDLELGVTEKKGNLAALEAEQRGIDMDEQKLEDLAQKIEAKRQVLVQYVEEFGLENGEEFAKFMRLFTILDDVLQTLPKAMEKLSESMASVQRVFQADLFRDIINKLPPKGQEAFLKDITAGMQALCQLGWRFLQNPLTHLINGDPRDILKTFDSCVVEDFDEVPTATANAYVG